MNFALISLAGLVFAVAAGILGKLNIGLLSIGVAYLIGSAAGFEAATIVAGWPTRLFFILFSMSFLFGIVSANGTLDLLVKRTIAAVKGHNRFLPLILLFGSAVLSGMGPGNIATVAIISPLALAISRKEGISPLLVAIMVILGANAGGLSPIAPTGIIANDLAREEGLEIAVVLLRDMSIVTLLCGVLTYFVLGGWRIPSRSVESGDNAISFNRHHLLTLLVVGAAIIAIVAGSNIGLTAFLASGVLLAFRVSSESEAMARVPWSAILLVCGVALLIGIVEETGGMQLLTRTLGAAMSEATVGPAMTVVAGLMSLVSSASGVVLPTLIPAVPGIVAEIGPAVPPEVLISSIAIGSHLPTVCPFSTLGALAIAAAGGAERNELFTKLILAGFSYLFVGAAISYFLITVL
ncbi:MAG: SLC13 family permease [Spirochaetales bacterium]